MVESTLGWLEKSLPLAPFGSRLEPLVFTEAETGRAKVLQAVGSSWPEIFYILLRDRSFAHEAEIARLKDELAQYKAHFTAGSAFQPSYKDRLTHTHDSLK